MMLPGTFRHSAAIYFIALRRVFAGKVGIDQEQIDLGADRSP